MVIWKFNLEPAAVQTIEMPDGCKILSAQRQGEDIYIWAACDEAASKSERHFLTVGTGAPMPEYEVDYISTVQLFDGRLVFHVFEIADERIKSDV